MKGYVCFECQFHWKREDHDPECVACPWCGSNNIVGLLEVLEE